MAILKNFIVVIILVGVATRISKYILSKYLKDSSAVIYVSSISTGILICSLASVFVGFGVVISEYLIAFIIWFIFDLLRSGEKKEK